MGYIAEELPNSCLLWQAFAELPYRAVGRDTVIAGSSNPEPSVFLIRSGFAYRACSLADGRRAILDVLMPGDISGVDYAVTGRAEVEVVAAERVAYQALNRDAFGELLKNPAIATSALARLAEARSRSDRLVAMIGRLDARGRLAALLLDTYDRLRRRRLLNQPTFKLPLTQEQIADHLGLTLVHVNQTLRRMREEGLVQVERQIVIILNFDGLRAFADGLPQPADRSAEVLDGLPRVAFEPAATHVASSSAAYRRSVVGRQIKLDP